MNATDFMKLLRTLHACEDARKWAEGKALAQVLFLALINN
jgi:hypothetical protein